MLESVPDKKISSSKIKLAILFFILVSVVGYFAYDILSLDSRVDACLDHGGSFDYKECKCDHINNHSGQVETKCQ